MADTGADPAANLTTVVKLRGRDRLDPFAIVAACRSCAESVIPAALGHEYEPGHFSAPVHLGHVAELEAMGWVVEHDLYGQRGRTDAICEHIQPVED